MIKQTRQVLRVGGMMLSLAAGAAWSTVLFAEPGTPGQKSDASARAGDYAAYGEFHTGADLLSRPVVNANGEDVGGIEDFIFDRGTGQIEYALVKSGAVLGIGGKTIAVSYPSFGFDTAERRFLLNMTREQVERASKFVPENWRELQRTTWEDDLDAMLVNIEKSVTGKDADPTPAQWADAREERVKGTITSVRRDDSMFGDEQIVAVVRTEDGASREIVLGPAWYVMGNDPAPMRGDTVDITTLRIQGERAEAWYGTRMTMNGKELKLRDKDANPAWRLPRDAHGNKADAPKASEPGSGRLMLLTDLIGAPARVLNQDGGEVQEVVIERASGRIAMIGFDPNQNVLGLGDKIRCVPWQVVSVRGDDTVTIDATKEMLQSCEPMPETVADFSSPTRLEPVYRAFQIDVPRFRPVGVGTRSQADTTGLAERPCAWMDAAKNGKDVSVSGKVVSTSTEAISPGEPEASIVVIESMGTRKKVVLGPAWYVERQPMDIKTDGSLTVNGRVITVNGQEYIVARTVTGNGEPIKLWAGDRPAWASR